MSGGILGNNNPYKPMMQGNQPVQGQQPQLQGAQQQAQQPMMQIPMQQMMPQQTDQTPQPSMQQIGAYQQKQQATQEYDIRNHMAMFLRSDEGQKVLNDFSKNPAFNGLVQPLIDATKSTDDQQQSPGF